MNYEEFCQRYTGHFTLQKGYFNTDGETAGPCCIDLLLPKSAEDHSKGGFHGNRL